MEFVFGTSQKHGMGNSLIQTLKFDLFIATNEILPDIQLYTVEWINFAFEEDMFIGRFYLLGKGDVYILPSQNSYMTNVDVFNLGENVFLIIIVLNQQYWFLNYILIV